MSPFFMYWAKYPPYLLQKGDWTWKADQQRWTTNPSQHQPVAQHCSIFKEQSVKSKKLPRSGLVQRLELHIANKCFIRRPAIDMRQIMILRLCCQGFQDGV
jgi:hypothetical protein